MDTLTVNTQLEQCPSSQVQINKEYATVRQVDTDLVRCVACALRNGQGNG